MMGKDSRAVARFDMYALVHKGLRAFMSDTVSLVGRTDWSDERDALAATKDFEAVTGRITLSPQRDAIKSAVILQVKGGKFAYLETVSP